MKSSKDPLCHTAGPYPRRDALRFFGRLLAVTFFALSQGHAQEADRAVRQALVDFLPLEEETEFYQVSAFPVSLARFGENLAEWVFWASIHFEMDKLVELDAAAIWQESGFPGLAGMALRSNRRVEHPSRFANETALFFSEDSPGFPQLSGFQRYFHSLFGAGEPYAWALRREGKVIRQRGYSPASHKSKTVLAYLTLPAALAQPALEQIRETREAAQHSVQLWQMRKIGVGVDMFMLEQNTSSATLKDAWSALGQELTPALGGIFAEFTFTLHESWTYTYTAPDGTRFHLDHTGRVWKE